jgi:hypothetical protein
MTHFDWHEIVGFTALTIAMLVLIVRTSIMFARRERPRPVMFHANGGVTGAATGQQFIEPFDREARRIYEEN